MIDAEYNHVIGWENRTFVWSQSKSPGYGILPANHRAVFCVDHQTTTEFRQTTVVGTLPFFIPCKHNRDSPAQASRQAGCLRWHPPRASQV